MITLESSRKNYAKINGCGPCSQRMIKGYKTPENYKGYTFINGGEDVVFSFKNLKNEWRDIEEHFGARIGRQISILSNRHQVLVYRTSYPEECKDWLEALQNLDNYFSGNAPSEKLLREREKYLKGIPWRL